MTPRFFNKKNLLVTAIAVGAIASKTARLFRHNAQVNNTEKPRSIGICFPPSLQREAMASKTHRRYR